MTKVKYVGGMDTRELSAADFKKLGVEEGAKKMTFQQGEEVEVEDNIADALMHAKILPGEFEIVTEAPADEESADGGSPESVEAEPQLTKAQQAKIDKAAKAGIDAASKKEVLPPDEEVAQDGHPQTTDTTGESSGATATH